MYEFWFDSSGKAHDISRMDTGYIMNCLNMLNNMLSSWRGIIPEQLNNEELRDKSVVGTKAWFVFYGIGYIDSFCAEIDRRKE